jgi:hypothetical protein
MNPAMAKLIASMSGIKRVQRGVTAAAGTVTIARVNMNRTFVISASKGSAGTVAARGTVAAHAITGTITGTFTGAGTLLTESLRGVGTSDGSSAVASTTRTLTMSGTRTITGGNAAQAAISGGATDLTVREYSARLISPTQLECDGPVEWQVIEG